MKSTRQVYPSIYWKSVRILACILIGASSIGGAKANDITIALHELPGFIYSDLFLYGNNGEVEIPLRRGDTFDDEVIPPGDAEIRSYHADFDVSYVVVSITDPVSGEEFELKNYDFGTGLVQDRGFVYIPDSGDEIFPQYGPSFQNPPPQGTQAIFTNGINVNYPGLFIGTGMNFETGVISGAYSGVAEFTAPISICKFDPVYNFELLNIGPLGGQSNWQIQSGATGNGAFVDAIGSPMGGGNRSLQLRALGQAQNVRLWRNIGCAINSGHTNFGYDFMMRGLTGSAMTVRARLDGANNDFNHQVFQSALIARTTIPHTVGWWADPDAFGSTPYQGIYYDPSLELVPWSWYRVEYDLNFDDCTIDSMTIYDISSGTKQLVLKDYDLGYFNNDSISYFKTVGSFAFGIDASSQATQHDGANVDNIGITSMARLQGTATLDDFQGDMTEVPLTVELREPLTGNLLDSHTVSLDSTGAWFVYTIPDTVSISIKGGHWLRKTLTEVRVPTAGLDQLQLSLVNGDIDNDNEINLIDFSELVVAFGTELGDTRWNSNADLNGDDEVNIVDYGILARNFGQMGDD